MSSFFLHCLPVFHKTLYAFNYSWSFLLTKYSQMSSSVLLLFSHSHSYTLWLNISCSYSDHSHLCLTLTSLHTHRCRMACPQWTAMSQLPASIPTVLPSKCRLTWGTAAPRRPLWPAPHGSHPVAVLSLPTAVISLHPLTFKSMVAARDTMHPVTASALWLGAGGQHLLDMTSQRSHCWMDLSAL